MGTTNWRVESTTDGLRIVEHATRDVGTAAFTWAHLLYGKLGPVRVLVIAFPSRLNLPQDQTVAEVLHAFGQNTGASTSVNLWDPKDPLLTRALEFFGLEHPPAVVLCTGLQLDDIHPLGPDKANLYAIVIREQRILEDKSELGSALNAAHEVLVRGNPREITGYIRGQNVSSFLAAIGKIGAWLRDALMKFKPKLLLPSGSKIEIG